jgi:hypothetical protein
MNSSVQYIQAANPRSNIVGALILALIGVLVIFPASSVQAQSDYQLILDTAAAQPGEQAEFFVSLTNDGPVGSFNLLLNYDPSTLSLQAINYEGTRATSFDGLSFTDDESGIPGLVRIIGSAELGGGPTSSPLPAGEGPIVRLVFRIDADIDLAGQWIPVWFEFNDPLTQNDNTLTDETGQKITQSEIDYYDGYITVLEMGEVLLGDINLNGFPYEVSDYVYFTNYFMVPGLYQLDALQLANSDMNQDLVPASISDLVFLINVIISGRNTSAYRPESDLQAAVQVAKARGQTVVRYSTDFPVGGVLLKFKTDRRLDRSMIVNLQEHMEMEVAIDGHQGRVFLYSTDGTSLPSGDNPIVGLPDGLEVSLEYVDLAGADGRTASVVFASKAMLPEGFTLGQNYPNPFNPQTTIGFDLVKSGEVKLTVFDITGRLVTTLIDGEMSAGRHEVVFDSRTSDSSMLASGVYFYRLSSDGTSSTRKMILMK